MQLNKKINFTEKGLHSIRKELIKFIYINIYIFYYLYHFIIIAREACFIKKIMYTNTLYNRIYCIYMWYLYNINKEVKLIEKNLLLRNFTTLFDIIGGPTIQDPFLLHRSDILSQNSSFRQLNVDIFAIHVQANICPAISSRF